MSRQIPCRLTHASPTVRDGLVDLRPAPRTLRRDAPYVHALLTRARRTQCAFPRRSQPSRGARAHRPSRRRRRGAVLCVPGAFASSVRRDRFLTGFIVKPSIEQRSNRSAAIPLSGSIEASRVHGVDRNGHTVSSPKHTTLTGVRTRRDGGDAVVAARGDCSRSNRVR